MLSVSCMSRTQSVAIPFHEGRGQVVVNVGFAWHHMRCMDDESAETYYAWFLFRVIRSPLYVMNTFNTNFHATIIR